MVSSKMVLCPDEMSSQDSLARMQVHAHTGTHTHTHMFESLCSTALPLKMCRCSHFDAADVDHLLP